MFLLALLFIFLIFATLISVLRIAIYGGSLFKPNFRKALERINGSNPIGMMMNENKTVYRANIVAYYVILVGWVAFIAALIAYIIK